MGKPRNTLAVIAIIIACTIVGSSIYIPSSSAAIRRAPAAETGIPTGYVGTWRGATTTGGSWTISLAISGGAQGTAVGTIAYPSLRCGGKLTLSQVNTDSIELFQDIVYGNCVDNLTVTLKTLDNATIFYEESNSNGQITGGGNVSRVNGTGNTLDSQYIGVWEGSAVQVNPNSQWPILMTLSGGGMGSVIGIAGFAPYSCGAEFSLTKTNTNSVELLEDVTYGPCWDLGTVTLTPNSDGSLQYQWRSPDNASSATGSVTRISSPPDIQECRLAFFGNEDGSPLRQTDSRWAKTPYGGYIDSETGKFFPFIWAGIGTDNIGRWGCTMTSAAMIVNYFAKKQGVSFQTDPFKLNEWLQRNDGYKHYAAIKDVEKVKAWAKNADNQGYILTPIIGDKYVQDAYVKHSKVAEYAREMTKDLPNGPVNIDPYDVPKAGRNDTLVNATICAGNPVMLNVTKPNFDHYVVATGTTSSTVFEDLYLHDPLESAVIKLSSGWNNTYHSYNVYEGKKLSAGISVSASKRSNSPQLMAVANTSVELLITDSQGRRTGFNQATNSIVNEIPNSIYNEETLSTADNSSTLHDRVLSAKSNNEETYTLTVMGEGEYGLSVESISIAGKINTILVVGVNTTQGSTTYTIQVSPSTSQPVRITRSIYLPLIAQ